MVTTLPTALVAGISSNLKRKLGERHIKSYYSTTMVPAIEVRPMKQIKYKQSQHMYVYNTPVADGNVPQQGEFLRG